MKISIEISDIEKDLLEAIIASKVEAHRMLIETESGTTSVITKHEAKLMLNFYKKIYRELTKDV